ncbi:hypothetical protein EUTSA_v10019587mg, partial [Eutrema salsugineum]
QRILSESIHRSYIDRHKTKSFKRTVPKTRRTSPSKTTLFMDPSAFTHGNGNIGTGDISEVDSFVSPLVPVPKVTKGVTEGASIDASCEPHV